MSTFTSSNAERALRDGDRAPTTYHAQAQVDLKLDDEGRFANKDSAVTGAGAVPQYPRAAGPCADPVRVPDEPPLGYAINDQEPTGTPVEVERSLAKLAASPVAPASVASSPPDAVEPGDAAKPIAAAVVRRRI